MAKIEMIGKRFGRLVVLSESYIRKAGTYWNCICDCGNNKVVFGISLRRSSRPTKSCGCLHKDAAAATGKNNTTHGMSKTVTYFTWRGMFQRCYDTKNQAYPNYGGRGIIICDRWLESFENFFDDMGTRPKGLTIERINNDLGYSPDNCKWATNQEQVRNRRLLKNNTSGVNGVSWHKQHKKYWVQITANCKKHHVGYYDTIEAAIIARVAAERKHWGKECN